MGENSGKYSFKFAPWIIDECKNVYMNTRKGQSPEKYAFYHTHFAAEVRWYNI